MTHSNGHVNAPEQGDDHNHDELEKRLREHLLEVAPSEAIDAAGDRVWGAIRMELSAMSMKAEAAAVPSTGQSTSRSLRFRSVFQYRNLLVLASSILVLATSAQFYVAYKQQQDGIVVSTVKRSEQPLRANEFPRPNQDWLPEEREIWRRLAEQLSEQGGDEFVFRSEVWDSLKSR